MFFLTFAPVCLHREMIVPYIGLLAHLLFEDGWGGAVGLFQSNPTEAKKEASLPPHPLSVDVSDSHLHP